MSFAGGGFAIGNGVDGADVVAAKTEGACFTPLRMSLWVHGDIKHWT